MTDPHPIEPLVIDEPARVRPDVRTVLRPGVRFLLAHPAHAIALGFGAGLSPVAPGTVGTLWAWLAFVVMGRWLDDAGWALVIAAALAVGWWACTRSARDLGVADPGSIVWDEVVAFWIVLWLLPSHALWMQALAFALFRAFDIAKPPPIRRVEARFRNGFGVMLDDLIAAFYTLLVIALGVRVLG